MSAVPYPTDDTQLAGLIQAATAAAGQEREWQGVEEATPGENIEDGPQISNNTEQNGGPGAIFAQEISASQIDPSIRGQEGTMGKRPLRRSSTRKRKRDQASVPALEKPVEEETVPQGEEDTPSVDLVDARAAGVHSATALFRQPSASSKKYTRPPMSKMFTSLEISPENFLHLQAAAKNYMLDPAYPDRRDCVGQRGRGDTDMVKLRLWNCVKDFLGKEGNGERFFGENTINEGMTGNKYIWPRDEAKIIKLAMPLLRRMVTNERQRQYANTTRKGGGDKRRSRNGEAHDDATNAHHPLGLFSSLLDLNIPTLDECDAIYGQLCSLHNLERFYEESYLMPDDFKSVIMGIYGHFHFFHSNDPDQCTEECTYQVQGQIFAWDGFSNFAPEQQDSSFNAIRELFKLIKTAFPDIKPPLEDSVPRTSPDAILQPPNAQPDAPPTTEGQFPLPASLTLQISILRNQKRILPRLDINVQTCPTFSELKRSISEHYADTLVSEEGTTSFDVVKVWVPDGLAAIQTEGEWEMTFWSATRVDWMDGMLKVLVELPATEKEKEELKKQPQQQG
ncbi:MAG: hypothetical protein Q9160_002017 [Pyrenula sp. 1 TL-2023]